MPMGGKTESRKIGSEQESWLSTADVLCYYFTRERDLMERILTVGLLCIFYKEVNCECVFDRIDTDEHEVSLGDYRTRWEITNRFSGKPVNRYMGHTGPVIVCPAKGPNFQGAVPSFFP